MRIIATIIMTVLMAITLAGCGGSSPATPSNFTVGPYLGDDGYQMWEFCSNGKYEPTPGICGICHQINYSW